MTVKTMPNIERGRRFPINPKLYINPLVEGIIIIRHAESAAEKGPILRRNHSITIKGQEQAVKIGEELERVGDVLHTADDDLPMQTAEKIQLMHPHAEITPYEDLRQRRLPDYIEGRTVEELFKEANKAGIVGDIGKAKEIERKAKHIIYPNLEPDLKYEGGESYREAFERISKCFEEIVSNPSKVISIVTHGGVIAVILRHLFGYFDEMNKQFWRPFESGSITEILIERVGGEG